MKVRFSGDEIRFPDWGDDLKAFIATVESALGTNARKRRFLIFVVRYEFEIDGETVPLFADEDGDAHFEQAKNSAAVKQKVIDRIKQSGAFEEQG